MSFAQVLGERARCESLDQAPFKGGKVDKKVFCPDTCKMILKRILLLGLANTVDEKFAFVLFCSVFVSCAIAKTFHI
jgi:hypothetical protein